MARQSGADVLVLPPIPLATGGLLAGDEGARPLRITKVELVVSTEDGGESRIPLTQRHGAWWAPDRSVRHRPLWPE